MSSVSSLNSLLSSSSTSSDSSIDLSSLLSAATGSTSTGIDVTSAVDAAVYAAQAPERQWQAQQSTIQSQVTALTSIQTAASTLSADLTNLTDPVGVLASRTVSSSNATAVTATASASTATGTHTVSVSQLATAASWYSPVVASANALLGSSSLTINQGNGTQTTFNLGSSGTNNLSALVQSINSADLGITASVVQDASGARLALVGGSTGSTANFTVSDDSASASTWSSVSLPSASSALAASTFEVGDGTSSAALTVGAGRTLSDVANQINAQGMNLSATVVTDGSGAHLSVTSTNGGQVTLSSDPAMTLTQASQAQNASFTVDGIPVSSASNTVTGALSGVTLSLTGTTNGSQVTLNVSPDTGQISSAISQFVSDYNSTLSPVNSQFTYSSSTNSQGVLGSDASLRTMQSMLLGMTSYTSKPSSSGSISTLADLGITVGDDGTLSLDSAKLNQALSSNAVNVQNFFQGASQNGFANTTQTQLGSFTDPSSGTLAVDIQGLTQQYNNLQSNVNDYESGYIASQKTLLTSMYSKAEIALQSLPTTLKQLQAELNPSSSGN